VSEANTGLAGVRPDTGQPTGAVRYQIIGEDFPVLTVELAPGQTIFTESGAMAWMSGNVEMTASSGGGLGKMFGRMLAGESLFITDFRCAGGSGIVAFAADFPGKIIPLALAPGQSLIAQKDAFLCAEKSVELAVHFRRRLGAGLVGGEGFVMQRLTGPGLAFLSIDGTVVEYTLAEGQLLKVDTGHVAALDPTVSFDIERVKGFANALFGGEGLFLATLRGPGRVWLQSMPVMNLAGRLAGYLPTSGGG
jgi:uncharacterized protein (TIGR00266 family)